MIIDKKGRLFGKISIIDIITLVLLLVLGYLFFSKLGFISKGEKAQELQNLQITFYQESLNDFTAESIKPGQASKEGHKNVDLGQVKDVILGESVVWSGAYSYDKKASRDDQKSIKIITEVQGEITDNGVIIQGEKFYVGDTFVYKVGNSILYPTIAEIKEI